MKSAVLLRLVLPSKRWTEKWRRDRLFKQISNALERGILVSYVRFERKEAVKSMSVPIKRLTKHRTVAFMDSEKERAKKESMNEKR